MHGVPRQVTTPHRRIPLAIPQGVTPTEFFNSPCNLRHLARENGLLRTPENFLMYRKAIGHSNLFDTSIILDSSQKILDPLGRPVRRDQMDRREKIVFSRMTQVVFAYMLEKYPDPEEHLLFCGEASLDATWPLAKPGVPSIRMVHNHFLVFAQEELRTAPAAAADDPNLTDSGNHGLFLQYLAQVYLRFFEILDLEILEPVPADEAQLKVTGYPQGLPSWRVRGDASDMAGVILQVRRGATVAVLLLAFCWRIRLPRLALVAGALLYGLALIGGSYGPLLPGGEWALLTRNGPFFSLLFVALGAELRLRGRLANSCIALLTFCAFLIGITIILLFLGETTDFQANRLAVGGFLAGVASFLLALVCFLAETVIATRLLNFPMLQGERKNP